MRRAPAFSPDVRFIQGRSRGWPGVSGWSWSEGRPCRLYRLVDDGKRLGEEAVEIDLAAQADAEGREGPASIRPRRNRCRPTRVVLASASEDIPLFHLAALYPDLCLGALVARRRPMPPCLSCVARP
jgi:hypothetical protein